MNDTFDFVMTDHAGWLPASAGRHRVFVTAGGGRWLATAHDGMVALHPLAPGPAPVLDVFNLSDGPLTGAPELATALRGLGSTPRFRNRAPAGAMRVPTIGQAVGTGPSRRLDRAFHPAHGAQ